MHSLSSIGLLSPKVERVSISINSSVVSFGTLGSGDETK
jgi:hypothetical protein